MSANQVWLSTTGGDQQVNFSYGLHPKYGNRYGASLIAPEGLFNAEFKDIVWEGRIERADPDPQEANEPDLLDLPRLRFRFDRHGHSRFRQMIDMINKSD